MSGESVDVNRTFHFEAVRKSNQVPKRRAMDVEFDEDDNMTRKYVTLEDSVHIRREKERYQWFQMIGKRIRIMCKKKNQHQLMNLDTQSRSWDSLEEGMNQLQLHIIRLFRQPKMIFLFLAPVFLSSQMVYLHPLLKGSVSLSLCSLDQSHFTSWIGNDIR